MGSRTRAAPEGPMSAMGSYSRAPAVPIHADGAGRAGLGTRVGEIVEASSSDLVAQSVRLHEAPPFGSLVRVPVATANELPTEPAGPRATDPRTADEPLGSMTAGDARRAGPVELYAIVSETRTASLEAGGRPIARGHEDVVDAAIYHENPDLEHVLRTEFRALLVGFRSASTTPEPEAVA